jgi:hypothetical protein
MPLDFPAAPTLNQKYPTPPQPGIPTYTWDGEKWVTVAPPIGGGGGGSTVVTSDTPPPNPVDGDQWYDTVALRMMVYYDDGNSQQWVDATPVAAGLTQADADVRYVNVAGDTMTGALTLSADPAAALQAATKRYVDATPRSYRNILGRNGGLEVWQRGAGGAGNFGLSGAVAQYTADGWLGFSSGNAFNVGQAGGIALGSRSHAYVVRTAGQTSPTAIYFECPLDTDEIAPMVGSIVTLSFTALCGSTYSPAGSVLTAAVSTGTGAPARLVTGGYTGRVDIFATPVTLTQAAQRFIVTAPIVIPANATQACVYFAMTPQGTAGAADFFRIDDVQLEIGSIATPFERRPFEQELLACRRHYEKTFPYSVAPVQAVGNYIGALMTHGVGTAGAGALLQWRYTVPKRVVPTVVTFNPVSANANFRNYNNTADYGLGVLSSPSEMLITLATSVGMVAGDIAMVHATADAGI